MINKNLGVLFLNQEGKNLINEQESVNLSPKKRQYEQELLQIIKSNKPQRVIKEKLQDYHDNDIASVLEFLTPIERKKLYHILGIEAISDVFAYLDDVGTYIEELDLEKAADIIEEMDADDAIDVLDELDDDKREELINLLDDEAKQDIDLIDSYDDDVIGSKMTTNFVVINKELSIKQAMKELVKQAADNDNISTLYVINSDETFYGAIDLKDLIVARENVSLNSIIVNSYPYLYANETISQCIEELKDYSEDSIPVLDSNNKIIGVITSQDIVEVVDEEMGEDYARLAGLSSEEDLKEPLLKSLKKRIPWLIILLFLALGVSTIVGIFESAVIKQLTIIVCFQSLILAMAGNVGTQTLAVTIRLIMEDSLTFKDRLKFIFKEVKIGFCDGAILGFLSFFMIGLYIVFVKNQSSQFAFSTSACIGFALLSAMTISSFIGAIIPLLFKKLKVDPAVASGPLISTISDLIAVVIYYGLAWMFLINFLHF